MCVTLEREMHPLPFHGNNATSIQSLLGQRLECSIHPIFGQDSAGRQMASLALFVTEFGWG